MVLFSSVWKYCQKHSWCDQSGRERGGKWSMSVSEWAEQMPLLFWSLKTHWEQSTLYLQSPLQSQHGEAWHKGQQSCDRTGSGQGQERGTDTSRSPQHNTVISTFPPAIQVANDSSQRVVKTRKCCVLLLWPFHPNLMFAFAVISIDWVYLVYTT